MTFRHNPTTHVLTIFSGASHDNNVEYAGLGHNSQDSLYRVPFGAVTPTTAVTLRFHTYHNDVTTVRVRLYDTASARRSFVPMTIAAADVSCNTDTTPPVAPAYLRVTNWSIGFISAEHPGRYQHPVQVHPR